jgi:predicted O-methyltransferase YrrM
MRSLVRTVVPRPLKSLLRSLVTLGRARFAERERVKRRMEFAMNYYNDPLQLIVEWAHLDTEEANFYYELSDLNRTHLAGLISTLTKAPAAHVESIFRELDTDAALREHFAQSAADLRFPRDIRFAYGRRLGWYAVVRLRRPRVVIETGVDQGVGSCVLCAALLKNVAEGYPGRYYGTDISLEAGRLLRGPYAEVGEVLYGDSLSTLSAFDQEIDLFINDSDHSKDYEYQEYRTIAPKLSANGMILGDNSHISDSLYRFASETGRCYLFFRESPREHWYPGAGIGIAFHRASLN